MIRWNEQKKVVDLSFGIDGGHQTSSTPFLALAWTSLNRLVLLDTYYYNPAEKSVKKAPSDYSKDLYDFMRYNENKYNKQFDDLIIDSAEGGVRNEFFKNYGIRIKAVGKDTNENMWDNVQTLMSKGQFYVLNTPNNEIFKIEHKNYEYKEGTIEKGKPEADKTEREVRKQGIEYYNTHSGDKVKYYADHTCDALKYVVQHKKRQYGLKF